MQCHVASCGVMWRHFASCGVMWCHVVSCGGMWWHAVSCSVMQCHVVSCCVMWCHVKKPVNTRKKNSSQNRQHSGRSVTLLRSHHPRDKIGSLFHSGTKIQVSTDGPHHCPSSNVEEDVAVPLDVNWRVDLRLRAPVAQWTTGSTQESHQARQAVSYQHEHKGSLALWHLVLWQCNLHSKATPCH